MNFNFLTFGSLIKAKIGGILNLTFFNISLPNKDTPGYEFDTYAKASSLRKTGYVSFYKKGRKKVFVKKHQYRFKDVDYLYILNEASVLKMLKSYVGLKFKLEFGRIVKIENFLELQDKGNNIYIVTSFEKGAMLKDLSEEERISVLRSCIKVVGGLYKRLPNRIKKSIPKRTPLSFLLLFPLLGLKLFFRDPKRLPIFLECIFIFYRNFIFSLKEKPVMSLSHRDLNKENILYEKEKKTATIVDWENVVITDRLYDIATFPWLYSKWISDEKLIPFLLNYLNTAQSRRRFVALAIYHAIQCISIYDKRSPYYRDVLTHLIKFKNRTADLILSSTQQQKF